MQEVAARGGRLILIGSSQLAHDFASEATATIVMQDVAPEFAAMVYAVPVQLLAYHTAVVMGKDADQPRNLAKSVTGNRRHGACTGQASRENSASTP